MSDWTDRVNQMTGATTYGQLQEAIEQARAELWRFTAVVKDQAEAYQRDRDQVRGLLGQIKREVGEALVEVEQRLRTIESDVALLRARGDIDQVNTVEQMHEVLERIHDGPIVLG